MAKSKSEDKKALKKTKSEKVASDKVTKDKPKKAKSKSKSKSEQAESERPSSFALTSARAALDPAISTLFANSLGPSKPDAPHVPVVRASRKPDAVAEDNDDEDDGDGEAEGDDPDAELSEIDEEIPTDDEDVEADESVANPVEELPEDDGNNNKRKRKRKDKHEDLEDVYMQKLAKEEAKDAAKDKQARIIKRQKTAGEDKDDSEDEQPSEDEDDDVDEDGLGAEIVSASDGEGASPPPMHETLAPDTNSDLAKSQRTVFLGNVSTTAITSKTAQKTLMNHLSSFFPALDAPTKGQPQHRIESLRFRSTAYASALPKKAAFAKKELMDATTKSTNAYAVYSSQALAREAARRLNGTVVLDRHIRVDEVAHPAKTDHKRCVFVGNLGFVDDETNIDKANEEEGKGKRQGKKTPSDVEEGLWRTFATCGTVESVRVVRDSKTRVGKGFAYVQFTDENGVEAALQLNEKKFPPMLPRKLRVVRAKAIKRNVKPGSSSTRAPSHSKGTGIYNARLTGEQQSQMGRAGRLLGRAGAAQMRSGGPATGANGQASERAPRIASGGPRIRAPEEFIFEGHRASSKSGKSGLKLGGSGKKKGGKPRTRSSNRGAAWKAGGGLKKGT
ncbi:hypothetical protein MBLNU459_g7854t1 [Dothideomycetes sp. NU459]